MQLDFEDSAQFEPACAQEKAADEHECCDADLAAHLHIEDEKVMERVVDGILGRCCRWPRAAVHAEVVADDEEHGEDAQEFEVRVALGAGVGAGMCGLGFVRRFLDFLFVYNFRYV